MSAFLQKTGFRGGSFGLPVCDVYGTRKERPTVADVEELRGSNPPGGAPAMRIGAYASAAPLQKIQAKAPTDPAIEKQATAPAAAGIKTEEITEK